MSFPPSPSPSLPPPFPATSTVSPVHWFRVHDQCFCLPAVAIPDASLLRAFIRNTHSCDTDSKGAIIVPNVSPHVFSYIAAHLTSGSVVHVPPFRAAINPIIDAATYLCLDNTAALLRHLHAFPEQRCVYRIVQHAGEWLYFTDTHAVHVVGSTCYAYRCKFHHDHVRLIVVSGNGNGNGDGSMDTLTNITYDRVRQQYCLACVSGVVSLLTTEQLY